MGHRVFIGDWRLRHDGFPGAESRPLAEKVQIQDAFKGIVTLVEAEVVLMGQQQHLQTCGKKNFSFSIAEDIKSCQLKLTHCLGSTREPQERAKSRGFSKLRSRARVLGFATRRRVP